MKEKQSFDSTMMFSKHDLIHLIWPLLLEQFLNVSIGMADTVMVAGVGEAAVSSVSLVDSVNVLIVQILAALATGGAVVSSQYLGHKDMKRAKQSAAQLYSALAFSTITVMIIIMIFSRAILRLVFGRIEDEVMSFAQIYFFISAASYPFIGFYNAGAALFRSQGNSKVSMRASLVMNLINVTGNALFIYGFHMGVLGAALATLLGRVFAAIWITRRLQRTDNPLRIDSLSDLRPQGDMIKRILSIGIPSGMENGMFQIGKLCVSSLTSGLGTAAIAANAVANTISGIANIPGSTMSLSTIPVVGKCLGAGEKKQAKYYARLLLGIAYAGIAIMNIALFFLIPWIAAVFNLSAEATDMCVHVMRLFNLFSIFFWPLSFTLPNSLRCGGDAKYTMIVSIISMWLFRVILSYFFVLKLHMGLTGVWLGMFIDWIFRGLCFGIRFISGKWTEHRVI